jgi:hypothetical protein
MSGPMHRDDTSLQGWGRRLPLIGETLTEIVQQRAKTVAEDQAFADGLKRIASQAEDGDLPVSAPLAAEMAAIAAEAQKIAAEEEALQARRAGLHGRAEALPVTYRREHETDEDRLNSPRRGSRAAEKRADVSVAEQDT